ncbi:MAG: cytochrome c oxidase subunit 3, partial [Bacteroidetes bacterium]|nr:cytochrome c oxidase subunit 3 [Bacteroidota bacterium]
VLWGGGQSPFSVTYGKMMMWFFLVSDALTFGGLLTAYGFARATSEDAWPIGEQAFRALPGLEGQYPLIYVALMTFILIVSSVTMVLAVEAGHRNDKAGVVKWLGATIIGGFFFLGSQAWEWSHFIHGSGGGFQLAKEVTVTTDSGESMTLPKGEMVFMDHHFGHLAEPWINGDPNTVLHADGGHITLTQYGEHEHAAELHSLTLNKYVENEQEVSGAEAAKLWNARSDVFAFGANLEDSEYAAQQTYANFFFFITGFHGFHVFSGVIINIIIFLMALNGVFERRGHYEMVEKTGLYWHFVDLVWVFVFTFFYLI